MSNANELAKQLEQAEQAPESVPVIVPITESEPQAIADFETLALGMVKAIKAQLVEVEQQGAELDKQIADNKKQGDRLCAFSDKANNFLTNLDERFDSGVDRNLRQLSLDMDKSFADRISEGLKTCTADLKQQNEIFQQQLVNKAVKQNVWNFWLTALYGLACGVGGSLGVYALTNDHKGYLWGVLVVLIGAYIADWRVNR